MPKTRLTNLSLTRTVVSILLVTTILIQVAVGGIFYLWQRSSQYGDLTLQLQQVSEQAAHHLISPIWNFDAAQIIQVVHNFALIPSISRITVRNHSGKILEDHIRDEKGGTGQETFYSQKKELMKDGENLGSVEVSLSTKLTNQRLRHYLISIVFSILILTVVQIVTLYLLLSRTIIQPLKAIENFAAKIDGVVKSSISKA